MYFDSFQVNVPFLYFLNETQLLITLALGVLTQLTVICSNATIESLEKRGVFIVNFEYISPLFLVFLLLALYN